MAMTAAKLTTDVINPDAELLAMTARHDHLSSLMDAFCEAEDGGSLRCLGDPLKAITEAGRDTIGNEANALERTITAMPIWTGAGFAGKVCVVLRAEWEDDYGIVEEILRLDGERLSPEQRAIANELLERAAEKLDARSATLTWNVRLADQVRSYKFPNDAAEVVSCD